MNSYEFKCGTQGGNGTEPEERLYCFNRDWIEVVADTSADMHVLKWENQQPPELEQDKKHLIGLQKTYSSLYKTEPEKAVDVIEQIYEISEKYNKLRMEKGL